MSVCRCIKEWSRELFGERVEKISMFKAKEVRILNVTEKRTICCEHQFSDS